MHLANFRLILPSLGIFQLWSVSLHTCTPTWISTGSRISIVDVRLFEALGFRIFIIFVSFPFTCFFLIYIFSAFILPPLCFRTTIFNSPFSVQISLPSVISLPQGNQPQSEQAWISGWLHILIRSEHTILAASDGKASGTWIEWVLKEHSYKMEWILQRPP